MLGEYFGGEVALSLGLVFKHIHSDSDLLPLTLAFASSLATDPALPGRVLVKKSLNSRILEKLKKNKICEKENEEFIESTKSAYFKSVTFALLNKMKSKL